MCLRRSLQFPPRIKTCSTQCIIPLPKRDYQPVLFRIFRTYFARRSVNRMRKKTNMKAHTPIERRVLLRDYLALSCRDWSLFCAKRKKTARNPLITMPKCQKWTNLMWRRDFLLFNRITLQRLWERRVDWLMLLMTITMQLSKWRRTALKGG